MTDAADILIVGGGPVGLFGAYYAGFRRMKVTLTDSLEQLGGQLTALYPEKYIYDVGGFPKVRAKELVQRLVEQAMQYAPTVCLGRAIGTLSFDANERLFSLDAGGEALVARSVLVAAGIGAFTPKRLAVDGVSAYEGRGLAYGVRSLEDYRGRRVLVIGGGDSAVDWANALSDMADSVTVIHRRDGFRAAESSVQEMRQSVTELLTFHELRRLEGNGQVQAAVVFDNRTQAERTLEVDSVLANLGFVSSLGPIREWGLTLQGSAIQVDGMMQTTRTGVFAAGDVATYPGKLKLIATGFGEAATAVNHAKHYLEPGMNVFPGHSSEKGH